MPSFMKDGLKEKDEQKLEEMQQEIEAAEAVEAEAEAASQPAEGETPAAEGEAAETEASAADPVAELKERIAALEQTVQEKDDRLKRLQADFENFRRRNAKEREELAAVVTQDIIKDLLPLLDTFDRALATANTDSQDFHKGVEMMHTQLLNALKKNGLEPIDTQDKMFDPNFHQAVLRVQNPELMDDMIASELQKGYLVKGHVVRPSMVQVVAN